ncbi:hypothetical protein O181_065141 [Austropuccinia psidii MF-1]|uniref:U3 small nucleolar RNA-associated protein 6 N-terminal domain-containing protein n=1 Tax=Austropuccinia psidii MF-1 TaxID=1389203 RepID=A0A9Q3EV28_9BASI|nr:hypothetical protein [Austropuccinia psidii MF-1]
MESAQLRMERMLPELRDLEQKKIFSKLEISAIVSQRKFHEASISRPHSPEPYLKYIDYEKRLEKLRRLRVGRFGYNRSLITLSDYSIPLHILNLYSAAVKRFPESKDLWLSYITYSLTQSSNKLVTRVLSAAIAAHPSHSDFWTMASRFEADGDETGKGGGNVDGARKLLLRGLRFFKGNASIPLWLEWIRIELNFIETIETRQKVLGLVNSNPHADSDTNDHKKTKVIEDDLLMQATMELDDILPNTQDTTNGLSQEISSNALKGRDALLSGALVKVVLTNSFKAVPDLSIFSAVLPLLHTFNSSIRPLLLDLVYQQLTELHPNSPPALVLAATRRLFTYFPKGRTFSVSGKELVDVLAGTIQELQQLCKQHQTTIPIWDEFFQFMIDIYDELEEAELRTYISTIIYRTIGSLSKKKLDSPRLHQLVIQHCIKTAKVSDVLQFASNATKRFSDCLFLWTTQLELLLKNADSTTTDGNDLKVFQEALRRFPGSISVADMYIQLLKKQVIYGTLTNEDLWDAIEHELEVSLKNPTAQTDESSSLGLNSPSTVVEVYQRALAECPNARLSGIEFYKYLSNKSLLSLGFLSWSLESTNQENLGVLEHVHTLVTSHPNAELAHWMSHLKFLLLKKKDFSLATGLLAKAKISLGLQAATQLEATWMKLLSSL